MRLIIQFSHKMALGLSGLNNKLKKQLMEDPCPVMCHVAGRCLSLEDSVTEFYFRQ